jgi:hypothetical protein
MVAEVDDLFMPIIISLNKKGFFTDYCCSGHYYEHPESYITFHTRYDFEQIGIPEGYILSKASNSIRREFIQSSLNDPDAHRAILLNALSVLKWTEELPDLRGEERSQDDWQERKSCYPCSGFGLV